MIVGATERTKLSTNLTLINEEIASVFLWLIVKRVIIMARKLGDVTETDVASIVVQIALQEPDGVASFSRIRKELPFYYNLSRSDLTKSVTRPNEVMWEQKIRNIKSHSNTPGNYIYEGYLAHVLKIGYRVTSLGSKLAKSQAA
jgi:hypothetical protein